MEDGQDETLVWSLSLIENEFLFSGDSKGNLKIWDIKYGTLVKSFNQLKADINTIAVNKVHGIVYATGTDSRILSVKFNPQT